MLQYSVTDCSAFDCEQCMQQSACGWCPSTSSCVTSDLMGPEKCAECPGGAYTENAALVCGGNSEMYEECLASFRTVDSLERDFLVSFEEFFLGPGKWLRYATAEEAFAFLDEDNDGILAFEEFCAFSGEEETGK
ncbi:Calmodulin [Balamuthia mandrillaris]